MTIKPVVRLGTANLSSPSAPITEFATKELYELLQDMKDTMIEQRGVGIAAPQIGVYVRVVIFGFDANQRYPDQDPIPFTVLINPTFEPLSDEIEDDWEGCLSIPGLRGVVPRYRKIKYSGYDAEGNLISRKVKDFHARVVQHELDHIDGFLYLYRMKDMRTLGYEEELMERMRQSRQKE